VVSAFNSTHLIFGISRFWPNQKLLRKLTKNYKLFTKTPLINCTQPQTNLWQCIAVICQRVSEEKPNQTTKIHVVSAVWGCVLIDKSAARSEVFTRGENMKSEMWMDVCIYGLEQNQHLSLLIPPTRAEFPWIPSCNGQLAWRILCFQRELRLPPAMFEYDDELYLPWHATEWATAFAVCVTSVDSPNSNFNSSNYADLIYNPLSFYFPPILQTHTEGQGNGHCRYARTEAHRGEYENPVER